ncbi:MAG: membrane protein insertase YidC [Clostridium sp.]|uniref:membrane protein insertase YidC n=1 Tax=Clostridium sp. TaxID=1506 RepID=UPI003EE5528B
MIQPIINVFVSVFDAIHHFIVSVGITNPGLSYVLAVILLTVIIKTLVLPFSIKSVKSTRRMQEFQPMIKKVQEKYKGDPQKANAEVMKIYKENNISMTGGCLPMLIPLPILMALYWTFTDPSVAAQTQGLSFLWIPNLSSHDPLYILPILSAVFTFIPSYLMTKSNPAGDATGMNMMPMNIGMSIMMGFISLKFPALLVIYWVTSGVYQLVQTYFLNVRPLHKQKAKQEAEEKVGESNKDKFGLLESIEESNNSKKKKKKK